MKVSAAACNLTSYTVSEIYEVTEKQSYVHLLQQETECICM